MARSKYNNLILLTFPKYLSTIYIQSKKSGPTFYFGPFFFSGVIFYFLGGLGRKINQLWFYPLVRYILENIMHHALVVTEHCAWRGASFYFLSIACHVQDVRYVDIYVYICIYMYLALVVSALGFVLHTHHRTSKLRLIIIMI